MANASIFSAFERMWQHTLNMLETKIDKTEVATDAEIMEMYTEQDIFMAVKDSDGAILTVENGNILLW
jgi:predicted nuclease of predicted toxin-antitoxin system